MVFENDYIFNVARLLVYIAQAGGEISAEEIKYFDDYSIVDPDTGRMKREIKEAEHLARLEAEGIGREYR